MIVPSLVIPPVIVPLLLRVLRVPEFVRLFAIVPVFVKVILSPLNLVSLLPLIVPLLSNFFPLKSIPPPLVDKIPLFVRFFPFAVVRVPPLISSVASVSFFISPLILPLPIPL